MKAIPTTYAGTTFRSRLEASVAAHLEKITIPWLYEPEGFELSDGTWYLPDFYLPTARAWMEVKGPHQERLDKVELFAANLWKESGAQDTYDKTAPMVVLVNAPTPETYGDMHLGMISVHRGGSMGFAKCDQCSAANKQPIENTDMDSITAAHLLELDELETALVADDDWHNRHPNLPQVDGQVFWVTTNHPYGHN